MDVIYNEDSPQSHEDFDKCQFVMEMSFHILMCTLENMCLLQLYCVIVWLIMCFTAVNNPQSDVNTCIYGTSTSKYN